MITTARATIKHLAQLAPLFDHYRIFYGQPSDIKAAENFLESRISKNESVILIAFSNGEAVGFTQLYPTFSSVSLLPYYILNDLFVSQPHRKQGIGEALLSQAKTFCTSRGCKGLALETAVDNKAQQLYEKLGWKKDSHCFHYFWSAK